MRLKELLQSRFDGLKIQVELNKAGLINADLGNELYFDIDSDLADQFECQAGMLAWWDTLRLEAEKELNELELQYNAWYSTFFDLVSNQLWSKTDYSKSTKPTNAQVEVGIRSRRRDDYLDWNRKLNKAKEKVDLLKSIVKWFEEKGMMLVQSVKLMSKDS